MSPIRNSASRASPVVALVLVLGVTWSPPAGGQETPPQEKLTLHTAVSLALEHHPTALAVDAAVVAAGAAVGQVAALRLPQLSFEASATRYQEPMIVAPLHALDITQAPEFDRTLIRGTASVAYTLFDGGVRGSKIRGARAELGMAESTRESALGSLIATTLRIYLQVLAAHDVLTAHDTRLAALQAELDRANKLFAEGTTARVTVLRAEAAIAQAEADRVAAAANLQVAEQDLARVTGLSANETAAANLVPVRLQQPVEELERDALLAQAVASNPELLRARNKHEATLASKSGASAMWLPNISLFGGYLGFGSGAGDLVTEWQGGAMVSYPIFTGGARSKTSARADALVDMALQDMRQIELNVQSGVDRGLNAVLESRARLDAVQEAVAHLTEVARIERLALDAGAGTQAEYLRSEAELLGARATLINARNAEITAMVELARIVGTLNQAWVDRELEIYP